MKCPHCKEEISKEYLIQHESEFRKINEEDKKKWIKEGQKLGMREEDKEKLIKEGREKEKMDNEKKEKSRVIEDNRKDKKIKDIGNKFNKTQKTLNLVQAELGELKKNRNKGQMTSELQGEVQQQLIQDFLQQNFRDDRIEVIKRFREGADILHHIKHKNKEISSIYIESKDTDNYNPNWESKFDEDMKERNIAQGFIVSRTMPDDFNKKHGFMQSKEYPGILIIPWDYSIIYCIVTAMRSKIIMKLNSSKNINVPKEMKIAYEIITGEEFLVFFRGVIASIRERKKSNDKKLEFLQKIEHRISDDQVLDKKQMDDIKHFIQGISLKTSGKINRFDDVGLIEDYDDTEDVINE